jgi:hypothetical protein
MLDLVDNYGALKLGQEPQRVFAGEPPLVDLFERHVAMGGKGCPGQGRLA